MATSSKRKPAKSAAAKERSVARDPDQLLTKAEVAEQLGCSMRMVERLFAERRFELVRLGRYHFLRVRQSELDRFIERQTIPARDD